MAAPASARLVIQRSSPAFAVMRMASALVLTDLLMLTVSVLAGFRLWSMINPGIPKLQPAMLLMPVSTIVALFFSDLYPGIGLTAVAQIRRLWRAIALSCLCWTAAMFLAKQWWADSRGAFFVGWLFSLLLIPAGRWLCKEVLDARSWWGIPVVVIGAGKTARNVIRNLRQNRTLGLHPVICVDDDPYKHGELEGVPVSGALADAGLLAERHNASYAIVAIPSMPRERLIAHMQNWSRIFPRIMLIPDMTCISSLWAEPRDLGGLLGLELEHKLLDSWNWVIKRSIDITVASFGLLIAGPVLLAAALLIRRISPGSPFYTQTREGRGGRSIGVIKLRTMHLDAARMLREHLDADPVARTEWGRYCKLKDDPRILPGIGVFLRKTSLDELPQLWNVLRGDMSLVGPRPFPTYHNELFPQEIRNLRTQVVPGITGLWQVTARSNGDLDVQASLDEYYIRNWSLWLDLYILFRTTRVVLSQKGSY